MRWQLSLVMLVGWMGWVACRPAPPQPTLTAPTPAALSTLTALLLPTLTPTSEVPLPSPTLAAATAAPSPTLVSPTLTAPPPSIPPQPSPPAAPVVYYFQADVVEADPGDTVTLSWATAGASSVAIYHLFDGRLGEPHWEVGAQGSVTYAIPSEERNAATFMLFAQTPPHPAVTARLTIQLRCTGAWFIAAPPAVCPQAPPLYSPAAEQPFEHGVMLWVGELDRIYVLYADDSPAWSAFVDEFDEGEPADDPTLTPPAGLYQPVRGFGRVWRSQPGVRDRLGWATAPEAGYVTTWQTTSYTRYNQVYLRGLDGGVYHLHPEGSRWEK